MQFVYQIKKWDIKHPALFTALRVLLGICLTIRGIYYLNNNSLLTDVIANSKLAVLNATELLTLFITWAHILGGTFIILGLFTPIAVWMQIPILAGAIVFINTRMGFVASIYDCLFALFILCLLALFATGGSGKISMDHYLKYNQL